MTTPRRTDNARSSRRCRAGPVRVTDWNGFNPPDGGKPILRIAARINELRKAGWPIERTGTAQPVRGVRASFTGKKKAA
jgi:hypothetical protein